MRVLFLPHIQRFDYFIALLTHCRRQRDWQIGVVDLAINRPHYAKILCDEDAFFTPPQFEEQAATDTDQSTATRIDTLIRSCEAYTGIPVGRVLLASERTIGCGFGREHYIPHRSAAATAAQRSHDATQAMLRRAFFFADGALEHFSPDFVVAGHNAQLEYLTIAMCARQRGIDLVFHRSSKLARGRAYWTRRQDLLNERTAAKFSSYIDARRPAAAESLRTIEAFRDQPSTLDYVQQRWSIISSQTWINHHKTFAVLAARRFKRRIMGQPLSPPAFPRIARFYRTELLKVLQARCFASIPESELRKMRYIYMALHKEPELALNLQAPGRRNQKNLIATAAAALPFGYQLLVREHRFNLGRRRTGYYRDILGYPNVRLISALDDQFKYIRHTSAILTDNGSTGWEGLQFSKPTIHTSDTFYDACGLATRVSDPDQLGRVLLDTVSAGQNAAAPDENDEPLALLLDAEKASSFEAGSERHHLEECLASLDRLISPPSDHALIEEAQHV